jgi:peptidoglycan/LPS O-acetylase OafA/YrhL
MPVAPKALSAQPGCGRRLRVEGVRALAVADVLVLHAGHGADPLADREFRILRLVISPMPCARITSPSGTGGQ